jgi:hypothetical protein
VNYINIHKVDAYESICELNFPSIQKGEEDHSLTDGEEIMACRVLLKELDNLATGEALVVWKIFG